MEKNSSVDFAMFQKNTDIKKIVLHHVSLVGIYTAVNIPCEDFERAFDDEIKRDTITNPNKIALLEKYMCNLRREKAFPNGVDTRAKCYFISSSDTIEYCLDRHIVYSNGIYYKTSDDLFDYIRNLQ